jgi:hypothetical protein
MKTYWVIIAHASGCVKQGSSIRGYSIRRGRFAQQYKTEDDNFQKHLI